MSGRFLESVWKVSGRCLKGVHMFKQASGDIKNHN